MESWKMRHTWLFQANPTLFDLEGFLASKPSDFLWLVTKSSDRMHIGDQVFLWRAVGKEGSRDKSGIVAEAEILSEPASQPDDAASVPFWRGGQHGSPLTPKMRVRLKLLRVANKKEVLQRDWLKNDPLLQDLTILKTAAGTNFLVKPEEATRLNIMWSKVGVDWTYSESVAGLWAYKGTLGKEVSKLPGSPVAQVSLVIGRAVGGVYNKVMNFRHLDPRDSREGLPGASNTDRSVWDSFFESETTTLKGEEIEAEFDRLWGESESESPIDEAIAQEASFDLAVNDLLPLSLEELLRRFQATRTKTKPKAVATTGMRFVRDPNVVAIAMIRAKNRCEIPRCQHPTFDGFDDLPFCEVHHIHFLSVGGEDTPENVACLCPAHHREAHHGKQAALIADLLRSVREHDLNLSS